MQIIAQYPQTAHFLLPVCFQQETLRFGQGSCRRRLVRANPKILCQLLLKAYRQEEVRCLRVLCDYLHLLERWKVQHTPKTPEDVLDDRFVEACQMLDYVEYLADLLIAAELEQRVKIVEMLNKDGLIAGLEERLDRLKKEDDAHEKQSAA